MLFYSKMFTGEMNILKWILKMEKENSGKNNEIILQKTFHRKFLSFMNREIVESCINYDKQTKVVKIIW